jgi:hypothetical protein
VKDAGLETAHPLTLPMIPTVYSDTQGALIEDPDALTRYKSLLGALLYIANYTRRGIVFAVSYLARLVNVVTTDKFSRVVDVIKYLHGAASYGLSLGVFSFVASVHLHGNLLGNERLAYRVPKASTLQLVR